jgi:hypothetical protein
MFLKNRDEQSTEEQIKVFATTKDLTEIQKKD